jgi:hypothetical protein
MKLKSAIAVILSLLLTACNTVTPASTEPNDESSVTEEVTQATTRPKTKPAAKETEKKVDPLATGKIINVYTWDKELAESLLSNCTLPEGYSFAISAYAEKNYTDRLDTALVKGENLSPDLRVDLFLTDFEYVRKYVSTDYAKPLSDLGITADDTANMYPYTIAYGTDDGGALKALTWQVAPDVFVFRRSVAEDGLYSKQVTPAGMAEAISTWDNLIETANFLYIRYSGDIPSSQRYKMFTSSEEFYRPMMQNANEPIVTDNVFNYPEKWDYFDSIHHLLTNRRYVGRILPETDEWRAEMRMDGMTLAFIGSKDFIDGVLTEEASSEGDDGTFGDWAVCKLPEQSAAGGTFLSVSASSDNTEIAADVIRAVCLDENNLRTMDIIPNSTELVTEYAASSDYNSAMLGGQNPFDVYHKAAMEVPSTDMTPYGEFGRIYAYNAVASFIDHDIDSFDALEAYIKANYPRIKVPSEEDPKYVKPGVVYSPDTSLL